DRRPGVLVHRWHPDRLLRRAAQLLRIDPLQLLIQRVMADFPRELSQRAAPAARVFICASLAGLLAACAGEPAPPLPALDVDPDRVAVAGLSSGAYMATQVHL